MSNMDESENQANHGRSFQTIMDDVRLSLSAMQQPADLIIIMTYFMPMFAPIRISIDAGVFSHLAAASPQSVTASELARNVKSDSDSDTEQERMEREEFMERMLRAVCSLNLVDEVKPFVYVANELTRTLAEPGFEKGYSFLFDTTMGPHSTISHLVEWARDHGYKAPTTSTDGPYQQARGIAGRTTFEHWVKDDPKMMSNLSALMKRVQRDRLNWSAWFPSDVIFAPSEVEESGERDEVFMVDVGGGLGHDLLGFARRYPDRKIRLVVQDLPEVIDEAKAQELDPRIELSEHDFFQTQPIRGAKIYFMHKIMHDWPDAGCIKILTHLREAMSPKSRIFINDAILPDQGTPLVLAAFDMTMLADLSAKERSESMWQGLISQVNGLAIRQFWQAPGLKGEGIVEVVRSS